MKNISNHSTDLFILFLLVATLGLNVQLQAQTTAIAPIAANDDTDVSAQSDLSSFSVWCLSDSIGFNWNVTRHNLGLGAFLLNGTCSNCTNPWELTGNYFTYLNQIGLSLFDNSLPACPTVGSYSVIASRSGTTLSGGYVGSCDPDVIPYFATLSPGACPILKQGTPLTMQISTFPNPASSNAQIVIVLEKDEFVKVQVFSQDGRLMVMPLDGVELAAGSHQLNVDVSAFSNGMYILNIQSTSVGYSSKLFVQH